MRLKQPQRPLGLLSRRHVFQSREPESKGLAKQRLQDRNQIGRRIGTSPHRRCCRQWSRRDWSPMFRDKKQKRPVPKKRRCSTRVFVGSKKPAALMWVGS